MKKSKENTAKTITVKQIRSVARRPEIQNEYLKGLGLGKLNKVRVLQDTPGVRGLLVKAQHLIEIIEVK